MKTPEDIRLLAQLRLDEAQVLVTNGRIDGAFYLAGYGVELALKAKIAERLGLPWLFDEKGTDKNDEFLGLRDLRNLVKTHKLILLLAVSGLKPAYDQRKQNEIGFLKYKQLLESWNEGLRYQLPEPVNVVDVQSFLNFLTGPNGFLQWIETN
ncbi:hypothetical protein [Hymenobacter terricola]|uniref:hypothetical protein n=1 Tax=Hymenobacter terricola TaxID=2819236 RepID=UPI001B30C774|nr:hypothetical protein [Hymenobacter terricola]